MKQISSKTYLNSKFSVLLVLFACFICSEHRSKPKAGEHSSPKSVEAHLKSLDSNYFIDTELDVFLVPKFSENNKNTIIAHNRNIKFNYLGLFKSFIKSRGPPYS